MNEASDRTGVDKLFDNKRPFIQSSTDAKTVVITYDLRRRRSLTPAPIRRLWGKPI